MSRQAILQGGMRYQTAYDLWQARKAEASKVRLVILIEARARVTFLTGFRGTQGGYRIIYAIDEKTKAVKLARILHRDRDYRELEQI